MVELRRQGSRLRLSLTVWTLSLELARLNGWSPAGTRLTDPVGGTPVDFLLNVRHLLAWQTEYRSSDGQTVTDPDAISLAHSLDAAGTEAGRIIEDLADGKMAPLPGIRTDAESFRWFTSKDGKAHLKALAGFCRGGAFQIF